MSKKRGAWCEVEGCEEPKNMERNAGLCTEHSARWLQSDDFRAATRDENVKAAMSLGLRDIAMRIVAKHRRRWVKKLSAGDE